MKTNQVGGDPEPCCLSWPAALFGVTAKADDVPLKAQRPLGFAGDKCEPPQRPQRL